MSFFDSEFVGELENIFLGGLDKTIDAEINQSYGLRDPSLQYEAEPGEAAQLKGAPVMPAIDNRLLIGGGVALVVVSLLFLVKK